MRYGIPAYRFPRERLDEDIRAIVSAGNVTVHTECRIDAEGMRRLSEEYDAVYVAIGAPVSYTHLPSRARRRPFPPQFRPPLFAA